MKNIYQKVQEDAIIYFNGSMYHCPKYKFNPNSMAIEINDNDKLLNLVEEDLYGNYIAKVVKLGEALNVTIPDDLFVIYS